MSERQLSLFQEIPVEEDLGGVVGDGLGPGEEAYEGELEELFLGGKAAAPVGKTA
ncbi:MAG: hypothetical protein ABSG63_20150 [Spirochaetia bacterium]